VEDGVDHHCFEASFQMQMAARPETVSFHERQVAK
jgi:hypothetical protein